jgi:hypothetical protein
VNALSEATTSDFASSMAALADLSLFDFATGIPGTRSRRRH